MPTFEITSATPKIAYAVLPPQSVAWWLAVALRADSMREYDACKAACAFVREIVEERSGHGTAPDGA